MLNTPFCSTEILYVKKNDLTETLSIIAGKNILLFITEGSVKRHNLDTLIDSLGKSNELTIITDCPPNPTPDTISSALNYCGNKELDLIIAIGGGSVIDLSKGFAAEYKDKIDIIAIPTTFGSGSELTQWATIWDFKAGKKLSADNINLKPKKAIICKEFSHTINKRLLLATTLDALSHAMEAYWSKFTNPLVKRLAIGSVTLITENLPVAMNDTNNHKARDILCDASVLSALAFSQTRTTACHGISYPLTLDYNIEHGFAVAMTLNGVAKRNLVVCDDIKDILQPFESFGGLECWLSTTCNGIVNLKLSSFGISEFNLNQIAYEAIQNGRMSNNPICFNEDEVLGILQEVMELF